MQRASRRFVVFESQKGDCEIVHEGGRRYNKVGRWMALVEVSFPITSVAKMIELSSEHQHFIDAQIAAGTFRGPSEAVGRAIELLRSAVDSHQLESIEDIRAGMEDAKAGRTKPLAEVAANIRAQLLSKLGKESPTI